MDPENHAGMLDPSVAVVQLAPHGPHARLDDLTDHFGQPAAADDLRVVVEETDDLTR
jgi:hypothetical protein